MNNFIMSLVAFVLVSCSSVSEKTISQDRSKPDWATQEKAFFAKDGKFNILGFTELDADAKISAGYRLSDIAARGEFSKMIDVQFSGMSQTLEEGVTDEGSMARNYASDVTKTALREFRITRRYWEKVQTFDNDGGKVYRLRIYSLGEIPESTYKKIVKERLDKDKMDPRVKESILNHFESEIKNFQASK